MIATSSAESGACAAGLFARRCAFCKARCAAQTCCSSCIILKAQLEPFLRAGLDYRDRARPGTAIVIAISRSRCCFSVTMLASGLHACRLAALQHDREHALACQLGLMSEFPPPQSLEQPSGTTYEGQRQGCPWAAARSHAY